ncbi:tctex1d1-b [Symbiodinium microadriaticum]|nr:tctex1d1-b [Symbiodinium microadriaticum]
MSFPQRRHAFDHTCLSRVTESNSVQMVEAISTGIGFAAMGEQHQVHVWENTYIMAPKDDEKMLPSKVTAVIKNVMESYLQDKEYAVEDAKAWTLDLSNEIKASVKQDLNIPRYKIIVQVNSDNWASYTFENQFAAMGEQHQVHVWENTYIMAPKDDEKMLPSKVTAVIKNVMESYLQDKEYAVEDAKAWTLDLSNEIKASVKQDLNIPRYKIIVQVVIGEQASQVNSDNWASYTFENQSLFAVGTGPTPIRQLQHVKLGRHLQRGSSATLATRGRGRGKLCSGFG